MTSPQSTDEFIFLTTCESAMEAHVMRTRMEAEGIECVIRDESPTWTQPIFSNQVRKPKLLVLESQLAAAQLILQEIGD